MPLRLGALSVLVLACGGNTSTPGAEPAPPISGGPPAAEVPSAAPVSSAPVPSAVPAPASHCVDLAAAGVCEQSGSLAQRPVPLVRASDLGAGFAFVSLHDGVAIAAGIPNPKAVVLEQEGTQVVELVDPEAGFNTPDWLMIDAWHSRRFERNQLVVLACSPLPSPSGRTCVTFSAERDPDTGRFGRLSPWEVLEPRLSVQGLVDLFGDTSEPWEYCVYGRGIQCRRLDGSWWEAELPPDAGVIVAMAGALALTESGTLLAPREGDRFVWEVVPASAPLTRLSGAGAFNAQGLWVKQVAGRFEECNQQPLLLAGNGMSDALDASGTPYSGQAQPPDFRYELCKRPSVMPGAVLGEAYLYCGISRNWVVMTSEAVFGMGGELLCALD